MREVVDPGLRPRDPDLPQQVDRATLRLAGIDVLVFTGGVGERSAAVRAGAADGLEFLGVSIDAGRNETGSGDREIGTDDARVRTLVVAAREDIEIANGVRAVVERH